MRARAYRVTLLGVSLGFLACAGACSSAAVKRHPVAGDIASSNDEGDPPLPPAPAPDYDNSDSGAFTSPGTDRPRDAAAATPDGSRTISAKDEGGPSPLPDADIPADDSGSVAADSAPPPPPPPVSDSGTVAALCSGPVTKGDLAIVELMIDSVAGSGDTGEWVEIQSTRSCVLNLKGLRVQSPRGAVFDAIDIRDDVLLAPNETFVVADSAIGTQNHALPGKVFAWSASDVLKNDGDTVTVKLGADTIDELVYGSFGASYPGRSLSFSIDCMWSDRSTWARWSWSETEWTPGFKGTPNTDNGDVTCY